MSRIHFQLPLPPEGLEWCPVDVMRLKGRLHAELDEQLTAALADGKNGPRDIERFEPAIHPLELQPGVVLALSPGFEALGLMLVCWDHAGGYHDPGEPDKPKPGSRLIGDKRSIVVPEGFRRGRG